MKQTIKQLSLLFGALSGAMVLAVVPVAGAEHGSDSTGSSNEETTVSLTSDQNGAENETETSNDTESLRDQAKQLLSDRRQNVKQHTTEQRQKACQARQKSLDTRQANFAAAAQRHLDVFNSIFTKVKAFHDNKQLTVENYDTLVASATAKQTAAQTAVDALKALDGAIDCTSSDPASSVATLKSAVGDARTALHAYRLAIKDVVVALQGASTAAHDTTDTTGGDQ